MALHTEGRDSHITMRDAPGTWVVRAGGAVIAESQKAVELSEGTQPPVIFFPRDDTAMAFLDETDHSTHCPHKGDARYFSVVAQAQSIKNAVWSYENPLPGVERIAGMLAFRGNDVTVEQL